MLPLTLAALTLSLASPAPANLRFEGDLGPDTFAVPPILKKNVALWRAVYGVYDSWQQVYYDTQEMDIILGTLDLRPFLADPSDSAARRRAKLARKVAAIEAERHRLQRALRRLEGGKRRGLSSLESRLLRLYAGRPTLRGAHRRVGAHAGLRDRFAEGLKRLARYRPYLVEVLRRHHLPEELLALAMTESLFNPRARSKAGAYGAWQFLKGTGREYLHINRIVDERRDPIVSTDAAARMLRKNLRLLKRWPLALTGYNYGPNGMLRAAKEVGSYDLVQILKRWRSKRFKFASRNYYASFLAALEVMTHKARFFPGLKLPRPVRFDTVSLPVSAPLSTAARHCRAKVADLAELNPALSAEVRASRLSLPRGFPLRVPEGAAPRCGRWLGRLARASAVSAARARLHRVRAGDSIIGVASRYGTTVAEILTLNGLKETRPLRVGERIRVPSRPAHNGFSVVPVSKIRLAKAGREGEPKTRSQVR
jgi:membrane-bound lytic murein transglycosylase D